LIKHACSTTRVWLRCVMAALAVSGPSPVLHAADPTIDTRIAVVYPRVREPYRSVFRSIASGAESAVPGQVTSYEVDSDDNDQSIADLIHEQGSHAAILLGKRGLDISAALPQETRKVVGAIFTSPSALPERVSGISLAPAPARLFARLRELAPAVDKVTVVYNGGDNRWLIELGQLAATDIGFEFEVIEAADLRDAATAYRNVLRDSRSNRDAIWLLQASSFLNENSVLQMILREAWDRNVVVFSSNASHVPKGALFSLYPDNEALGAELARLAADSTINGPELRPVNALLTAINIRTADHLGLGLSNSQEQFDLVFPTR